MHLNAMWFETCCLCFHSCLLSPRSAWWHCVQSHWPGAPTKKQVSKEQGNTRNIKWMVKVGWSYYSNLTQLLILYTECQIFLSVFDSRFSSCIFWERFVVSLVFGHHFLRFPTHLQGDDWSCGDVGGTFDERWSQEAHQGCRSHVSLHCGSCLPAGEDGCASGTGPGELVLSDRAG